MAELIIIFSCFVLLPDLITVIVAFSSRKSLKTARIKDADKYSEKLKEADLSGEAFPLNSDDGEMLKQRHSRLYGLKYNKGWFVVTDSNNHNHNIITEKTLAEMVKEDKENGIERHMSNKGV